MTTLDCIDHDLTAGPLPIPVTVLTGFLGAGKTTLLNRILNGDHGLKVAVLVNDFGSINIDADLIVNVESDVVSLANGCICCTLRDDLEATVTEVIDRPEKPEYILLECGGVAEPSGIAMTFTNPGLRDRIRLDSITCVVDAEQLFADPQHLQLKLWQIGCADMLILNKVDLVGQAQIDKIKAWLDSYLHRYRLIEASHCDVPLEILLSVGRFDPAQLDDDRRSPWCGDLNCGYTHHNNHDYAQSFSAWSYETDRPLSLEALRETASRLPNSIYRAKGVVYCADVPGRRVILQVVGKRADLALEESWGDRTPRTRIVAIGAPGSIDEDALRERFEQCLSPAVPVQ